MKINTTFKNVIKPACLIAGLFMSTSTLANLINSDFSDELHSWNADYSYFDGAQEHYFEPVTNFANFADNFSTGPNRVTLNTSMESTNEVFGLYLFQEFEVAVNSFELSLNFDYLADNAYVTLVDENLDLVHDFMNNGLTVDISAFAGALVSLEFGIEDDNFIYDDFLTVSDIYISQKLSTVPEPSSLAILTLALAVLSRRLSASLIRRK